MFALADDAKRSVEQVQRSLDSAMAVTGPMLTCPTCGSGVPHLRWRSTSEPTMTHLGGYCSACGRWLQWLPQVEPWVTLVVEQGCQGAP